MSAPLPSRVMPAVEETTLRRFGRRARSGVRRADDARPVARARSSSSATARAPRRPRRPTRAFPATPWRPIPPGDDAYCNICGWQGDAFEGDRHVEGQLCPRCGSSGRDRFSFFCFVDRTPPARWLPGAGDQPPPGRRLPRRRWQQWFTYTATDYDESGHRATVRLDLQDIDLPPHSVDVLLTAHVLEHVPDTDRALAGIAPHAGAGRPPLPPGARCRRAPRSRRAGPEFHEDDTTVFWRFGFDLADRLRRHGFATTVLVTAPFADAARTGDGAALGGHGSEWDVPPWSPPPSASASERARRAQRPSASACGTATSSSPSRAWPRARTAARWRRPSSSGRGGGSGDGDGRRPAVERAVLPRPVLERARRVNLHLQRRATGEPVDRLDRAPRGMARAPLRQGARAQLRQRLGRAGPGRPRRRGRGGRHRHRRRPPGRGRGRRRATGRCGTAGSTSTTAFFPEDGYDLVVNHAAGHHISHIDRVFRALARAVADPTVSSSRGTTSGPTATSTRATCGRQPTASTSPSRPSSARRCTTRSSRRCSPAIPPRRSTPSSSCDVMRRYFTLEHERALGGGIAYLLLTHNPAVLDARRPRPSRGWRRSSTHDAAFTDAAPERTLFAYVIARPGPARRRVARPVVGRGGGAGGAGRRRRRPLLPTHGGGRGHRPRAPAAAAASARRAGGRRCRSDGRPPGGSRPVCQRRVRHVPAVDAAWKRLGRVYRG